MELQGKDISKVSNYNWTKPLLSGHFGGIIKINYKFILYIRKVVGGYLKKKITTLGNKMPSCFFYRPSTNAQDKLRSRRFYAECRRANIYCVFLRFPLYIFLGELCG